MPSKLSKNEIKQLIKNSSLENGALVSVNSELFKEEKNKDLHFVFLSEAALGCIVAKKLGLQDEADKFFNWLTTRLENSEVLYKNYSINGSIKERVEDKNAAALLIISGYLLNKPLGQNIAKKINQDSPFYPLAKKCFENSSAGFLKKLLILKRLKKILKKHPLHTPSKSTLLAGTLAYLAN